MFVCDEKQNEKDNRGASLRGIEPAMCGSCKQDCEECGIAFHKKCKIDHLKRCNRVARAKRSLANAEDTIECKTFDLETAKRHVASLEEEIRAAKRSKVEAQEELQSLKAEEQTKEHLG